MSIVDSDLKFFEPAARGDFDGSGSFQTATELGTLAVPFDQLFPDTSDMDQLGRVDYEKFFTGVASANVEPLLGAYAAITQSPTENHVSGLLFAGTDADIRSEVISRIEAYRLPGPEMRMFLLETHFAGQSQITVYLADGEPAPNLGTVICLSIEATGYTARSQYLRIQEINDSRQVKFNEFIGSTQNTQEFTRTVLTMTVSASLLYDFPASKAQPFTSTTNATKIRSTRSAADAHYYGVQTLADDLLAQATELRVVSTERALLPSNQQDNPFLSFVPLAGRSVWYPITDAPLLTRSINGQAGGTVTLYFPLPFQPGSVVVTLGSLRFEDNGSGILTAVTGNADGYTVQAFYSERQITVTRTSTFSVTCTVAAQFAAAAQAPIFTQTIEVTDETRRQAYTFSLSPTPAPTSVQVEYFARGDWITLRDTGAGVITGGPNEGTGTLLEDGSGSVNLGILPDINSTIIITWCAQLQFQVTASYDPPTPLVKLPTWRDPNAPPPFTSGGGEPSPLHTPTANAGNDTTVVAGNPVTLNGSLSSDPDHRALQYRWRVISRPWNAVAEPANASIVSTTITPDVAGTWTIGLKVSNSWRVSTEDTLTIVVTPDTTPRAKAGRDLMVPPGSVVYLDGRNSLYATTWSWTLTEKPGGSAAALTGPTTSTPTLTADKAGTYRATLSVNGSATDEVRIDTTPRPPTIQVGQDQTVDTGSTVVLSGAGSTHPDGESVTWTWRFIVWPGELAPQFSDPHSLTPNFTAVNTGIYVAELAGFYPRTGLNTRAVTVIRARRNPLPNPVPLAGAGQDTSVSPGSTVSLFGTGSNCQRARWYCIRQPDSSNQPVLIAAPSDNFFGLPSLTSSFVPSRPGTYRLMLVTSRVSNGGDGEVSGAIWDEAYDDMTITVSGTAPVANAGDDRTVVQGAHVSLDGSRSYSQTGQGLRYAWTFTSRPNGSNASLIEDHTPYPSFTADQVGSYILQLTVTDAAGSASDTVTITATAMPSLPAGIPGDMPPEFYAPGTPGGALRGDLVPTTTLLFTEYVTPGTLTITGPGGIFLFDDWCGNLAGSAAGYVEYTGKKAVIAWTGTPPSKGTVLTVSYLSATLYSVTTQNASFPSRDSVTNRATFSLPGDFLPNTVSIDFDLPDSIRQAFFAPVSGGLNQSSYKVVDNHIHTYDDGAGTLIAPASNFGRARYQDGIVEIDTRAYDDPVRYYGGPVECGEYFGQAAGTSGSITISALSVAPGSIQKEVFSMTALNIYLSVQDMQSAVSGALYFSIGSRSYYERNLTLYRDRDPVAGTETAAGTVSYAEELITITDW